MIASLPQDFCSQASIFFKSNIGSKDWLKTATVEDCAGRVSRKVLDKNETH